MGLKPEDRWVRLRREIARQPLREQSLEGQGMLTVLRSIPDWHLACAQVAVNLAIAIDRNDFRTVV